MNDCYLNFLVSFRALFSLDVGANLVNSKQTIGIILPDLSLLGYAVPVESFGIGLFVILFAYLIIEYNVQLLSHEKFKIAMNMLHTAHRLFISDGQYLSIADKYRNETKEKQRQRMKQVWIFLAINLIWVIFCIFLFIKVIPPPSNADTSNKNPSPEYIEMLKDIRDRRAQ